MPSATLQATGSPDARAELQAVLESPVFVRSPALAHLLSYLCQKTFSGESGQIKEYSIALDVFGRKESFEQESDSIVRVEANRLRKRLAEYYAAEGAHHRLRIRIPVGQYVPVFEDRSRSPEPPGSNAPQEEVVYAASATRHHRRWLLWMIVATGLALILWNHFFHEKQNKPPASVPASAAPGVNEGEATNSVAVFGGIRILAGGNKSYIDHSGKIWIADTYYSGGVPVHSSMTHIWRTQDPAIYRNSRQGDFAYAIPLKPGTYELRLHFAETVYGPEEESGGGEGSRLMAIRENGRMLLNDLDVVTDSGDSRTADVKVFSGISAAGDGMLHLDFTSANGARAMLSGIEVGPGVSERMQPLRIVARDVPYYSNDSHWWSADSYFRGGQLGRIHDPVTGTDDPELYETERWGHFSYAVPVVAGRYTVVLHFVQRNAESAGRMHDVDQESGRQAAVPWIFDVFCNGRLIIHSLNLIQDVPENRALVRRFEGLEPNAQGKLLLEFVPSTRYASVSAIEVLPQ